MNIIIVGCGRVGAELSYRLFKQGHQVTVIDEVPSAFENLPSDFRGRTIEGEVLSPNILHRAGIEGAHGLATVTSSDSLNAVVAHLARTVYHIPNVVVRSYSPRQRPLLEAFGLQVVSPSSWGALQMEKMLTGIAAQAVYSAGNGELEVYQLGVPPTWEGRPVSDLNVEGQRMVIAVIRGGQAQIPTKETLLQAGDVLDICATDESFAALSKQLDAAEG